MKENGRSDFEENGNANLKENGKENGNRKEIKKPRHTSKVIRVFKLIRMFPRTRFDTRDRLRRTLEDGGSETNKDTTGTLRAC